MKTIPPPCPEPEVGPKYWRSLDQIAETPEFNDWVEREFPAGASELNDPVTRRYFMKIMSASFALAGIGLTGCRKPEEYIYPFSKMPEGYVHGVARYYATARPARGSAVPLLVRSNEGRPTKIEGNASHPDSNGGTDTFSQASILDLYDPDRARRFTRAGQTVEREAALTFLRQLSEKFRGNGGQGLAILTERTSSPSEQRLQALIRERLPQARWHVHEPIDFDASSQALGQAFGQPVKPLYQFGAAQVIVSLDSDFLGAEEDAARNIRGFANGRRILNPGDAMNRLYAVEGLLTVTGAVADHRLRVPTSAISRVAAALASQVLGQSGGSMGALSGALQQMAQGAPVAEKWVSECARDLIAHRGQCLVVAGYRQPPAVHLMAAAMNAALGNVGTTVTYHPMPGGTQENLSQLATALNNGAVDTLVILGSNPIYSASADLNWAATQRKAQTVVRLGYSEDETFAVSDWQLPLAHFLESWGDARTSDGTLVPIQPMIQPLFGGLTVLEVLGRIAGLENPSPYQTVRETFATIAQGSNVEEAWKRFLHDGYLSDSASAPVQAQLNPGAVAQLLGNFQAPPVPSRDALEVVFYRDYRMDDGRFNNNGWLMELPDPITKIVWDNPVAISRRTAAELNVRNGELVDIEVNGRKVRGPAWIVPGFADFSIGLALGYGRSRSGRVGGFNGQSVGYNAYLVRQTNDPYIAAGGRLAKTGTLYPIATTQDHGMLEGRPIIREANLEQYRQRPDFAKHMDIEAHAPNAGPIYQHPYTTHGEGPDRQDAELRGDRLQVVRSDVHQWGMSIDLNGCVGCGACVLACQSENNIPIVGKDQVIKGREMHWLRIDRYFSSSVENPNQIADDPQVNNQPMLCQHCENAPCESVCPVNATVHDAEGLNTMAYNRCVGTRYCSNNCPWKVRRFNFFDYNKRPLTQLYRGPLATRPKEELDLVRMAKNPDVTVRMRGVMEKCTFCTQRIEGAKIAQKVKAGPTNQVQVPDGAFTTACAQACPADAIVFGNLLDRNSRVSKLKEQQRDYAVLGFLGNRPRLTYLARLRNPNPQMPDYYQRPQSLREYEERRHDNPFAHHTERADRATPPADQKGAH